MSCPDKHRYKPDARESALLFLRLMEAREMDKGKPMTRARLPRGTLKDLWKREKLTPQFLEEVHEWMLTAGWTLVDAGSTFAAVRVDAVLNWPRVSLARINDELLQVSNGEYDYEQLEHLWASETEEEGDEQD